MDIHHAVGKRGQHHRRQQPHETRAYYKLDAMLYQRVGQSAIEVFARGEPAMLDDASGDAVAVRTLQPLCARAVGNYDADFGAQLTALERVDYRLQVGAGA